MTSFSRNCTQEFTTLIMFNWAWLNKYNLIQSRDKHNTLQRERIVLVKIDGIKLECYWFTSTMTRAVCMPTIYSIKPEHDFSYWRFKLSNVNLNKWWQHFRSYSLLLAVLSSVNCIIIKLSDQKWTCWNMYKHFFFTEQIAHLAIL